MEIPDPVKIGWPGRGHPREIGLLEGHDLLGSFIPGHKVIYEVMDGKAVFRVGVSYVPSNPKRKELEVILIPKGTLPEEIWDCVGFTLTAEKPKGDGRPPPTPRVESFVTYLERRRNEQRS